MFLDSNPILLHSYPLRRLLGMFTIGITGNSEVRCQSYYDEGYMRMYIILEHMDATIVGQMEFDLIHHFRKSPHLQNSDVKKGKDSMHQLLKHPGPYHTWE